MTRQNEKWDLCQYARHPVDKCEMLQASMARALKALIIAQGQRVRHRHDLNALWEEAEAHGERINASRDPEELARLSRYAGEWQYAVQAGADPAATWSATQRTGNDLLNHARERVPQMVEATTARLRAARKGL